MVLHLTTAATQDVGSTPRGRLFIFPISAVLLKATGFVAKCSGGADWATATADGAFELISGATLETDDGALIYLTFTGVRDDARQYVRTLPRFETAAPQYDFLNRLLAVGAGEIHPDGPVHIIEELL
jgi:hypothetical protein